MSQRRYCRNQNNVRWCIFNGEGQGKRTSLTSKGKGKRGGNAEKETVAQMESALLSPKPSEDEFVPFFF